MAKYHVGGGLAGIYAGTFNKEGISWQSKTLVTNEAINAVRDHLVAQCEQAGMTTATYEWQRNDGKRVQLVVRIKEAESDD